MYRNLFVTGCAFGVCLLAATSTSHGDWTRFRGPNGSGLSPDTKPVPVVWSPGENLKWKTALPGPGVSSPIIVGDRVYVTCYSGYGLDRSDPGDQKNLKRHLVCIRRSDGKMLWSKTVDPVLPEDPFSGAGVPAPGYASSTPVSDGKNVFVFFGKTGALAFDPDGKQLWHTKLGTESDPRKYGSASSPILYKNLLIVPATCESEALIALDKKTGKEVWRQEATGFSSSWSTPILVKVSDDRTDLVLGVAREIWGINPETGKLRWYCEGAKGGAFYSSVVARDGVVYAVEGRSGGSLAVRAGGKGDVTKTHVLWTGDETNSFGSPILHGDRVYVVAGGIAKILDSKTGKKVHQARLEGSGRRGGFGDYPSPIIVDAKLYVARASGDLHVLRTGDQLEQLALNRVTDDDETFGGTPAVSDGELFLRSNKHLYCVAAVGKDPSYTPPKKPKVAEADTEEGHGGGRAGGGRRGRGGFDPEAMFKQFDANGDGKLVEEEFPERMRANVKQIDTDKDGFISLEEFRSGRRQLFGRGGRGGRGPGRRGSGGDDRDGKPDRPQRPELDQ